MPKKLTKLRIDEISSVDRGAGEGCKVLLYKRDNGDVIRQQDDGSFSYLPSWTKQNGALLFDDIMLRKAEENDDISDKNMIDPNDTPSTLLPKLNEMVRLMVRADPSLTEEHALFHLLNHPRGRKLAEHLNNLSKGKQPMPQVDILKLVTVLEDGLMAQVTKRDGESYAQSFSRRYENDIDFRRQWTTVTEAKQLLALSKGMATLTPTSVEVGSTLVADDSAKAVAALRDMAEKNGRAFEVEFADPANAKLAAATYTQHHRSSVNTDYLEQ